MDRDALLALDKDTLVGLVLELRARVAALEAERGGPLKTPDNSSVPPAAVSKPNRAERRRRKRGPKRGHVGSSRRRARPDVVVPCRPSTCRGCGAALPVERQRLVGRSQVVELPAVRPLVIEAQVYAVRCGACGERTAAPYPRGLEPARTFGPRVEALLGYLHYTHHLSHERLVAVSASVCGLAISAGAVEAALERLAARARPAAAAIREEVRSAAAIGSDETGVRVDGENWWHWVFQTSTASYHEIRLGRGAVVIEHFLGGAAPEVWASDAYAAQLAAPAAAFQLCLAHQVRDLTYAEEADGAEEARWARQVRHVLGRAVRLHHERDQLTQEHFANRRTRVERAAERLVFGPPLRAGEARQLQKRYQRLWDGLFTFLGRADVEPTNNASERDLRNSVIHDKVTGGYRSAEGAQRGAIFATVLATARKRGENLFERLCTIAGPSPLHAAGMAS